MIRILATYLLLLFYTGVCNAQDPNYFVIGENELANSNIYTILYDDNTDILYVGTNNGLYAYRQNKFIKLKNAPNQIGTSIFKLEQAKSGTIYCCNLNGQIFKVHQLELELFFELDKKQLTSYFDYLIATDGVLIVSSLPLLAVNSHGKIIKKMGSKKNSPYFLEKNFKDEISLINNSETYRYKNLKLSKDHEQSILIDYNNPLFIYTILTNKLSSNSNFDAIFKEYTSKYGFLNTSFRKVLNKNEVLFLNKTKGGQIISLKGNKLVNSQVFFKNDFLSCVTINESGTLFFGSFGEGIKVMPNRKIYSTESKELFLSIASSQKNDVFVSTRSGKVFNLGVTNPIFEGNLNIDKIFYTNQKYGEFNLIFVNNDFVNIGAIKDIFKVNDSMYLVCTSINLYLISNQLKPKLNKLHYSYHENKYTWKLLTKHMRYTTVGYDENSKMIYYATNFGTFKRHWKHKEYNEILYQNESIMSKDIAVTKNHLILATQNEGVLFYANSKSTKALTKENGLLSNSVKKVDVLNNSLFILTNKGLQLYNLITEEFVGIGIEEGIIDNVKITDFSLSNNKIWLLEKHKYYGVNLNIVTSEKTMGKLYIDSTLVNSKLIDYTVNHFFEYNQNEINFYFDYRDIETKKETKIYYTLEGFYDSWKTIESSENKIEFQSLPVGKYTFKIKASYRTQETHTFEYYFEIQPPFWQRLWFYILIILITIIVVLIIARYRFVRVKKRNVVNLEREVMSKDLAQTKLKALRSQMNPHFIFNALNSIQNLVLQEDVDKSYDYIVLFSELVRSSLVYSDEEFITIDKEIEFLEVYLELEKLRYGDDLIYNISYIGSEDVKIPSLVVQPFIENALLHGLSHKDGEKKITITFTLADQLICTIIDNGIGREKAGEIKKRQQKQHTSFSTKAIKQRMKILSNQYNMKASFKYEDVVENNIVKGTKVEIIMPFQHF